MRVTDPEDINRVIAYVNIMEEQIKKDIEASALNKKLVKRTASEMFDLKHEKYPDMTAGPIELNAASEDEELLEEEPLMLTARYKQKLNINDEDVHCTL